MDSTTTNNQLQELVVKLQKIEAVLLNGKCNDTDFVDNQEFCKMMGISKRTSQQWRDEGKISFSQIGGKIYYRMVDVQKLLDSNYHRAFHSSSKF